MTDFKTMIANRPDLQSYAFRRGFLLTDALINTDAFPFYGHWNAVKAGKYTAYTHELQKATVYETNGKQFLLLGHAFNPFTMTVMETEVLARIAESYGTGEYWSRLSEITGVYVYCVIDGDKVEFIVDPSGMQSAYYGVINGKFYITSHSQIIGDLCGLEMNELTKELINYKWYHRVMGDYLPADMTQFDSVKRIVPSIAFSFDGHNVTHKRFWPTKEITVADTDAEYQKVINDAAEILKNNMQLIARKWQHPAISLTGGIDSNTTFASANGIYDKFTAFSYVSAEKEIIDAEAAQKIAGHFGVKWQKFDIPATSEALRDFKEIVQIIEHNNGYIIRRNDNEYRKRVYLMQNLDCDVEVKSWVSETIRAYWYKHYGRKAFPKLSPKLFRNFYKIFILNRRLAHKVDKVFEQYIKDFEYESIPSSYPIADMNYNEVTWGSWGGPNISEMKMYADITFVYNNRRFFDLMFRVPLEKRISDQHHLDLKKVLNKELYDMNIRVVNLKETDMRARLLNVIFAINSWLPF
ncbi:MAG: hypothetical protein IKR85_07695 [Clostridia bacterium]|nr:hypothetical protein [Clostridia bacterium]